MNCRTFIERMDGYLERTLAREVHDAAAGHLRDCGDCQRRVARLQALRGALRAIPVPAPRPGLLEQALERAQRVQPQRRRFWPYVAGAALAASITLWIGFGRPNLSTPSTPLGVNITLNETHTVQLAFNAERELPQATLSIQLPNGVELQGFPGQREVRWQTTLVRGANVLALPLLAKSANGGTLLARVEHGDRRTELAIPLHVSDRLRTSAADPAHATDDGDRVPKEVPDANA
ncbi:MAG: anti-sigma factor family protein [Sulfurifustis sp.]